MEIPAIHRHANRRLENASTMKQSMLDLKQELRGAKTEQKLRRIRSLGVIIESSIHPGAIQAAEVARRVNETRQITQLTKEHAQKIATLDHKVRSAIGDAHVLIDLARHASGGQIYAKHQADTMIQR
jgi:hypothetical protein